MPTLEAVQGNFDDENDGDINLEIDKVSEYVAAQAPAAEIGGKGYVTREVGQYATVFAFAFGARRQAMAMPTGRIMLIKPDLSISSPQYPQFPQNFQHPHLN